MVAVKEKTLPFLREERKKAPQVSIEAVAPVSVVQNMAETIIITFHVLCPDLETANGVAAMLTNDNIAAQLCEFELPRGQIEGGLEVETFHNVSHLADAGPISKEAEVRSC